MKCVARHWLILTEHKVVMQFTLKPQNGLKINYKTTKVCSFAFCFAFLSGREMEACGGHYAYSANVCGDVTCHCHWFTYCGGKVKGSKPLVLCCDAALG